MKIVTVLGTRPEIIRLSEIIPLLDRFCDHKVVYTGQNYDKNLKDIFFSQLGLRDPDYNFSCKSDSAIEQISIIFCKCEEIFKKEKPEKILILGDTNSALCAFVAKRIGIPVYHMEAGNRCFDNKVPEEVNRKVIDHCSAILMPYTERSKENLTFEGIPSNRIFVTGNPILEVLAKILKDKSSVLKKYGVEEHKYFLVTLHREENVDVKERLIVFMSTLSKIQEMYNLPMLFSVHPRTKKRLQEIFIDNRIIYLDPLPFKDFVNLEIMSRCVLTDSGTVQEETCIYKVPCVTLRDTTERPETMECGSNLISGCDEESILSCVNVALSVSHSWCAPKEYLDINVSEKVLKILMSKE